MKSKIVTTVAAALVAGVAGLTLATQASAAFPKLGGLCPSVNAGFLSEPGYTKWSGWKNAPCANVLITTSLNRSVRGFGHGRFNRYKGKFANVANIRKCQKSVVIVRLYKRNASTGTWQLFQTRRAKAVATLQGVFIKRCSVEVATGYTNGGHRYRSIVFAVDGGGGTKGVRMAAAIRSQS